MTISLGDYPIILLLVLFRVSGFLVMIPFFGIERRSKWLLAATAFPMTLVFCSVLPEEWKAAALALQTHGDVVWALTGEVLLGAAIGAIIAAFVGISAVAGTIAGRGTSLMMAQEVDPISGESAGVLIQILRMVFLVILLTLDAHLAVIRLLAESFQLVIVPWTGWLSCGRDIARLGSMTLQTGTLIAMPVLVATSLVTLAMGLLGRFAQEFNVMFLSMPFRIVTGISIFGLSILMGDDVFRSMAHDMLTTVARFLMA